jgi:hypothetical protein
VALGRTGYRAIEVLPLDAGGTVVHLKGFGPIRVFRAVSRDGSTTLNRERSSAT